MLLYLFHASDILHTGRQQITCTTSERSQCHSPLRSVNLFSIQASMKSCGHDMTKPALLASRYMEMRQHLTTIASKCSILLTRQLSKYAYLTPLYVSVDILNVAFCLTTLFVLTRESLTSGVWHFSYCLRKVCETCVMHK
jgi:hypothetical protein